MDHTVLLKLGQAIGACAVAESKLKNLKGLSFNQETKDFILEQLKAAQEFILETAEALDDADKKG